jgi:hypothetical protein
MNLHDLFINNLLKSGRNASNQIIKDKEFRLLLYLHENLFEFFFLMISWFFIQVRRNNFQIFYDSFINFKFYWCLFWIF